MKQTENVNPEALDMIQIFDSEKDCIEDFKDDYDFNWPDYYDRLFLIQGTIGKWDGKHTIYPVVMSDLWKCFEKCWDNMDYVVIFLVEGKIEVTAKHHDGTNHFTITMLNSKGEDLYNETNDSDDLCKEEYFEKIIK